MEKRHKAVWVGPRNADNDPELAKAAKQEFYELPVANQLSDEEEAQAATVNRRDFLKLMGFGLGAATLAACEAPVRKAIPYVVKPDSIVPGVANYYASSFVRGGDYAPILVKTRDGRPIKIEGNSMSEMTYGGTSARVQGAVLDLYNTYRFQGPGMYEVRGTDAAARDTISVAEMNNRYEAAYTAGEVPTFKREGNWQTIDNAIGKQLNAGSRIRIVANTILSPTTRAAIAEFQSAFPNTELVQYDAVSYSGMLDANRESFGRRVLPRYRFDRAKVIVSFGADFLGTWISPIEFASGYARNRVVKGQDNPEMSRHYQVECGMSMTGSNADHRILVRPSETASAIAILHDLIARRVNGARLGGSYTVNETAQARLEAAARDLYNARGESLVVCGSNDKNEQLLVNSINSMLGNYGTTIDMDDYSMQRQGSDADIRRLISEMKGGSVDALFVWHSNPAFDLPEAGEFALAMMKVPVRVAFNTKPNETVMRCQYITPDHELLESWGDVQPTRNTLSMIQPTIKPLFDTRKAEISLLKWAKSDMYDEEADVPYFNFVRGRFEREVFPSDGRFARFVYFWDNLLHDGVYTMSNGSTPELEEGAETSTAFRGDVASAARGLQKPLTGEFEISFIESVAIGGGEYADNPWLQEMPDPVTRGAWGNYLRVPIGWDGINRYNYFKGTNDGDLVNVTINGITHQCTVMHQFGQMPGTVTIELGYGRTGMGASPIAEGIGVNVYPWLKRNSDGYVQYFADNVEISGKVGEEDEFACVQYHHTFGVRAMGEEEQEVINVDEKSLGYKGFQGSITERSVLRYANLDELPLMKDRLRAQRAKHQELNSHSLYPYEEYKEYVYEQGHWWGMFVDLNACIGCGACTVACMAENNVPVVGKREVSRHHEMAWLRIDRYYYGDVTNPKVAYQPMMCQHCDNAPCENVCPVAATNHSSEGLNQMTYNRCIGTRYCANNCPYKVRRFNWLDYTTADLFPANEYQVNEEAISFGHDNLTRMVLNPDVTVRSRGVIEKCSFCVQRLQAGKLQAKIEKRRLRDSDVRTACQTACPTGAIVFGDRNNKDGDVMRHWNDDLAMEVLEEVNTRSAVRYTAKIHNADPNLETV